MSESLPNQKLFAALAKAQGEMDSLIADKTTNVKSDKANYSYKYADLASVLKIALKTLSKHGLGIMQIPTVHFESDATYVNVGATLFHDGGDFIAIDPLPLRIRPGATAQEVGSAITYARRYQLQSVLGMAADDDDGASASKEQEQPKKMAVQHRQAQPATTNGKAHTEPEQQSAAFKRLMAEGNSTFDKEWEDARHWLIERYTKQATPTSVRTSAKELSDDECVVLADSLAKHRGHYQGEWQKQRQSVIA